MKIKRLERIHREHYFEYLLEVDIGGLNYGATISLHEDTKEIDKTAREVISTYIAREVGAKIYSQISEISIKEV